MKIYCRNCQERIKLSPISPVVYVLVTGHPYSSPSVCRTTGGGHEPR